MTTPEALEAIGCTYRQLDYWVRKGYLTASSERPGSGRKRTYTESEAAVGALLVRLISAGLTVDTAAHHARALGGGHGSVEISGGIRLTVARLSDPGEGIEQPDGSFLFSDRRAWVWP